MPRPIRRSTATSTSRCSGGPRAASAVLEGRLAAFMADRAGVPALKVFLDASEAVRAERIARPRGRRHRRSGCARSRRARRRTAVATATSTGSITTTAPLRSRHADRPRARPRSLRGRDRRAGPRGASPTDDDRRSARQVRAYNPAADLDVVQRAYDFSAEVHRGQRRQSGEPYLTHPLQVASDHRGPPARRAERRHRRCCTTRSRTRSRRSTQIETLFGEEIAGTRRRRHQDRPDQLHLARGEAGRELPQDAAGDGARHPRHPGQARRPHAQHADARPPAATRRRSRSRRRRSTSTRRSPTVSASTG